MKLFQLFESKELATELIWFRRFISENDLETEIEVEGDKLVVYLPSRKTPLNWNTVEAKRIRTEVLTDAFESRWYAEYVLKGPFEFGEKVIATNAVQSRWYAEYVLKGPFKLGEPVIATNPNETLKYKDFLATLK